MSRDVLIVDDEPCLCSILEELLTLEGYRVCTCRDARSARRKLAEMIFDLAMLDVFLFNKPYGLDLGRYILAEYPATRVVFMTGYADSAEIDSACLSGAYTCIAKPFDLDDVVRVIGIVLADT